MIYYSLYIFSSAISLVWMYLLGEGIDLGVLILFSTFFAVLLFNAASAKELKAIYPILLNNKFEYGKILISTCIMWLGTFFVTIEFSPTILDFLLLGVASGIGAFFDYRERKQRRYFFSACLVFIIILAFLILNNIQNNGSNIPSLVIFIISFAIADSVYAKSSSTLEKKGLSGKHILSARFFLLLIVSPLIIFGNAKKIEVNFYSLINIFGLSVMIFIVPMFFYQKMISKLGANKSLLLSGTLPLATFAIERIILTESPTPLWVGIFSLILTISVIFPICIDVRMKNDKEIF